MNVVSLEIVIFGFARSSAGNVEKVNAKSRATRTGNLRLRQVIITMVFLSSQPFSEFSLCVLVLNALAGVELPEPFVNLLAEAQFCHEFLRTESRSIPRLLCRRPSDQFIE